MDDHPRDGETSGSAELFEPDPHVHVARFRLIPIGAEKPVPPVAEPANPFRSLEPMLDLGQGWTMGAAGKGGP
jgi:hypothetical protein